MSPDLATFPPELHQVVVDVAVSLAYGRGYTAGYRGGWDAGNHVGFGVRDRVEADRQRRLDDARAGHYRSKRQVRDDRLVDNLRQSGLMAETSA